MNVSNEFKINMFCIVDVILTNELCLDSVLQSSNWNDHLEYCKLFSNLSLIHNNTRWQFWIALKSYYSILCGPQRCNLENPHHNHFGLIFNNHWIQWISWMSLKFHEKLIYTMHSTDSSSSREFSMCYSFVSWCFSRILSTIPPHTIYNDDKSLLLNRIFCSSTQHCVDYVFLIFSLNK